MHKTTQAGWERLYGSWRDVPSLVWRNPEHTGFMRHRAAAVAPVSRDLLQWRPIDRISPFLVAAVLHAEDPEYFRHNGIWWEELRFQVAIACLHRHPVRAVSTITQQLARNVYLHPGRTYSRKLQEALLARRLESALDKRRILELYLNVVEWGNGVWGAESASRSWFGCAAVELDPFEAVVLASFLPAPRAQIGGTNAARAIRVQRRLASILYGSRILSRTEERQVYDRIATLEQAIADGADPRAFLNRLARPAFVYAPTRSSLTPDEVIRTRAGIEWRRHYEQFLGEFRYQLRAVTEWPEWWNGAPLLSSPAATGDWATAVPSVV